jgi:hypothetical protein
VLAGEVRCSGATCRHARATPPLPLYCASLTISPKGISDIDELVEAFAAGEDTNLTLFNHVTEVRPTAGAGVRWGRSALVPHAPPLRPMVWLPVQALVDEFTAGAPSTALAELSGPSLLPLFSCRRRWTSWRRLFPQPSGKSGPSPPGCVGRGAEAMAESRAQCSKWERPADNGVVEACQHADESYVPMCTHHNYVTGRRNGGRIRLCCGVRSRALAATRCKVRGMPGAAA